MDHIKVRGYLSRSFFLLDRDRYKKWDPWPVPVMDCIQEKIFCQGRDIVQKDNCSSIDNYVDKIELLPAHLASGIRPSTSRMKLFSLRCPSRLPIRIFLWITPSGKLMVRDELLSVALTDFLQTFRSRASLPSVKMLGFWKAMQPDSCATFPSHLRDDAYRRWRHTHSFRFLDLPAEIREKVIEFYLGSSTIMVSSFGWNLKKTPSRPSVQDSESYGLTGNATKWLLLCFLRGNASTSIANSLLVRSPTDCRTPPAILFAFW